MSARYARVELGEAEQWLAAGLPSDALGILFVLRTSRLKRIIPGSLRASIASLAEELGQDTETLEQLVKRLEQAGAVQFDRVARHIYAVGSVLDDGPRTTQAVKAFARDWHELPDGPVRAAILVEIQAVLQESDAKLSATWQDEAKAYAKTKVKTYGKTNTRSNGKTNVKSLVPLPVPLSTTTTADPPTAGQPQAARATGRRSFVNGPDPRIRRYGRVNVWQQQHDEFRNRLGLTDVVEADERLDAFYATVEDRWSQTGEVPIGRPFELWQREFDRAFGAPATNGRGSGHRVIAERAAAPSTRWEALCEALEVNGTVNRHDRFTWLAPCRVELESASELRIRVPAVAMAWIEKHYQEALAGALATIAPECRLLLVTEESRLASA